MSERRGFLIEYKVGHATNRLIVWAESEGAALRRAQLERHWAPAASFRVVSRSSEVATPATAHAAVTRDTPVASVHH